MKAAVYYETGGPDVFRYEDVPDPVAGPGRGAGPGGGRQHRGGRHPQPAGRGDRASPRTSSATSAPARWSRSATGRRRGGGRPGGHRGAGRLPRRAAGGGALVLLGHPRRAEHRGGGLRPGALRHRRRLPVRVRPAPGPARPPWSMPAPAAWDRRHPAGQAGRGQVLATASSVERLERLAAFGLDHGIDYTATDFVDEVRD